MTKEDGCLFNKVEGMLDQFVFIVDIRSGDTKEISTIEQPIITVTYSEVQQLPVLTTEVQPMPLSQDIISSTTANANDRCSISAVSSDTQHFMAICSSPRKQVSTLQWSGFTSK